MKYFLTCFYIIVTWFYRTVTVSYKTVTSGYGKITPPPVRTRHENNTAPEGICTFRGRNLCKFLMAKILRMQIL